MEAETTHSHAQHNMDYDNSAAAPSYSLVSKNYHNYNYSYYHYNKKAGCHTVAEHKQEEGAAEERVDLVVEAVEVMDAERWRQTHSSVGEVLGLKMKVVEVEVVQDTVEDDGDDDGGGAGDDGCAVGVYSI